MQLEVGNKLLPYIATNTSKEITEAPMQNFPLTT